MAILGISKQNEIALDQQLSVGGLRNNGKLINAALHNGFLTNFQGCYLTAVDGIEQARLTIDAGKDPYTIGGVSQMFHIWTTSSAAGGFPDASAASDRGVLRLTNADTNTTKLAMAVFQNNALWIAPTSFTAVFDIAQWTQRSDAGTTQWAEFGVCGTCNTTHLIDSAKEIAYNDGTNDYSFAKIKLSAGQGKLVYKALNTGASTTAVDSASFDLPTGAFSIRLEYNSATAGGSPTIAVFVDNVFKLAVQTSLAGPFQLFARTCHSASYASGTQAPTILDIDAIAVAIPN